MSLPRSRASTAVFVATLLVLTVFLSAQRGAAQEAGALEWESCGGGWDCAVLEVPRDYDDPDGPTIELAVTRLPAGNPGDRIGVLLANPGGPGAEGIGFIRTWTRLLGTSITERFEIVGFDPRGVGRSTPIACNDTLLDFVGIDPAPQDLETFNEYVAAAQRFADDCMDQHAALIPHVGTLNAARDMDELRAALGEEQLNYVGYSYGTRLGAVYADLFPDRVRAFVFDGAVDASLSGDQLALEQARGFERALRNFIADCEERDCSLTEHGDIYDTFRRVLETARIDPIPAPGADRDARPGDIFLGIVTPLYSHRTWPLLETAIGDAVEGDASLLVFFTNTYLGRQSDGSFGNLLESNLAINCADRRAAESIEAYEDYLQVLPEYEDASPLLGGSFAVSGCIGWPASIEPLSTPSAVGADPILVIGTTGDPATPYEWSEAMASQLESGVLVRHEGEGHTVYALGNSRCVDTLVNGYLLELVVPESGTSCSGSGDPVPPGQVSPDPTPTAAGPGAPSAGDPDGAGIERGALIAIIVAFASVAGIAAVAVVLWRRA